MLKRKPSHPFPPKTAPHHCPLGQRLKQTRFTGKVQNAWCLSLMPAWIYWQEMLRPDPQEWGLMLPLMLIPKAQMAATAITFLLFRLE